MSVWEELGLHVFCLWVCTCLHTCGCVHVFVDLYVCIGLGVHSSVSASLFLPLCVSPSESLSIPVFDSLILSLGIHVCLSTYMGGSLALLCFSASLCTHFFVIISPSLCMPLSFTSVFPFHSPPIPPFGFSNLLCLLRYANLYLFLSVHLHFLSLRVYLCLSQFPCSLPTSLPSVPWVLGLSLSSALSHPGLSPTSPFPSSEPQCSYL